jgi:hypothetical protein
VVGPNIREDAPVTGGMNSDVRLIGSRTSGIFTTASRVRTALPLIEKAAVTRQRYFSSIPQL